MKRPGPPCTVCIHPRCDEIDGCKGAAQLRKANGLGISRASLDRHRKHASKLVGKGATKTLPPPPPTSERDALLDALARLKASLAKAEADDLPRIANAITAMGKRLQALDEDRDVTEADIVKSAAWRSLLGKLELALRPYPDAARAMARALSEAA